jgi:drug/metabolite transporter (DMT)-like permease
MKNKVWLFVWLPLFLVSAGEFILKASINSNPIPLAVSSLLVIATTPFMLLGVLMVTIGGLLWIAAMSRFELSFIYPFLSLNYVAIIIGSQVLLNEHVSFYRYLSAVFIVIGLFYISKSPHIKATTKTTPLPSEEGDQL